MIAFLFLFSPTCDVVPYAGCLAQAFASFYTAHISAYGISALVLYRLACITYMDIKKRLNICWIIISISVIWLLPAVVVVVEILGFEAKIYYARIIFVCLMDSSKNFIPFYIDLFFSSVLPNILVLGAYFISIHKIRRIKKTSNAQKPLSPPKITIQLILFIIFFEMNCVSTAIIYYQTVLLQRVFPDELIRIVRLFRWIHHFSPLALLYFHPVMITKFKYLKNGAQRKTIRPHQTCNKLKI